MTSRVKLDFLVIAVLVAVRLRQFYVPWYLYYFQHVYHVCLVQQFLSFCQAFTTSDGIKATVYKAQGLILRGHI